MNVLAFSTPGQPDWRWRIVDYNGETVEESYTGFPTIAAAVAGGNVRLRQNAEREGPLLLRRGR
jgi:hypothetical protein